MSFPKTASVRVYRYGDKLPDNYSDIFIKGVIEDENDPSYAGIESFGGWCNPDDIANKSTVVNYIGENFEVGYVRFTRTVPGKALKYAVDKAVKRECEAGNKVSRARKRELKELYKIRMLREVPVQPTVTRVIVSPASSEVMVFSSSNSILVEIVSMFRKCFGISLFQETIVDYIASDDMCDVEGLGENYLTWLWYVSETDSFNQFSSAIDSDLSYTISPDSRVVVGNADIGRCSVSGDIREAKNGVFNGKGVTQFSFVLYPSRGEESYHTPIPCVVNSGALIDKISFKGLPLNGGSDELQSEADALMCLDAVESVRDFLKSSFSKFWEEFSNDKVWQAKKREIWTWARGDVCIRAFEGV